MSNPRSIRWLLAAVTLAALSLHSQQQPPAQTTPAPARGGRAMTPEQQAAVAAMQKATEEDHQNMMDQLGIKELRRGRDGSNKDSPYYANYDESKANPYPTLPDPLKFNDGKPVKTAKDWTRRRAEIVELFDREIYGRVPKNTPKVNWEVISNTEGTNGEVPILTKILKGHVDNSIDPDIKVDIDLMLVTPAKANKPVPVVMQFGFPFNVGRGMPGALPPGMAGRGPAGPTWQQQVLDRGWGYAVIVPGSIQADNGAGLTQGIIGLCNRGQRRGPDDWGVLRAWAWGASRALDYFETDKSVDARHVAVEGHSRYGKATLVAVAYDQRFWAGYVSSSGEGGAKLNRRNWGEVVENIAGGGGYHWMAGNFLKYAGPLNWNDLPVDSHEMIALVAPRPVFISAGTLEAGDGWIDSKGSFLAAVGAGPVYKLLGKRDLGTTVYPPVETALVDGDIAFRQHSAGHTDGPNWPYFLDFAGRHLQ